MKIELHVFTNCTSAAPDTSILRRTYNSFFTTFGHMPFYIWVDSHPNKPRFERYFENIAKKFGYENITESESLSDGYIKAIKYSKADYLFMLEHDWIFDGINIKHSLDDILANMKKFNIYHLRFNKRENTIHSWDREMTECGDDNFKFCKTNNLSNNPHIINRKKYLEFIDKNFIKIKSGSDGIEQEMLNNPQTWGAIYGGLNYPQIIHHLDGSGKWKTRDTGEFKNKELTSIIIPTIRTQEEIKPLIAEIKKSAIGNIEIVATCKDLSPAKNRNLGLEMSTGKYVIMIDDDIQNLPSGFDEFFINTLKSHPEFGIISARLLNKDGSAQLTSTNNFDLGPEFIIDEVIPGACMSFRNVPIRFDEHFIDWGYEDTDFCHRMPGKKAVCNRLQVTHINEEKRRNAKSSKLNTEYFNNKWGMKKKR